MVYANPASEILTGWRSEEILGNNIFQVLDINPSATGGVTEEKLTEVLSLTGINYLPSLAAIKTKSGRTRTVDLKTALIKDDSDEQRNILLLMNEHTTPNFK